MFNTFVDRSDALLAQGYARLGLWAGSVVISAILVLVVWLYVDGGTEPISGGVMYAELSQNPFTAADGNPLRYRILAPLIGWVLYLRGPLFVLVPWLFLLGFLAVVNVWSAREGAGPTLALCITLAMAFSPVTMHSLVAPGWVDAVSYFMLGMALMNVRNTFVSGALVAMAVMTHEVSAFLIPAWLFAATRIDAERGWWIKRMLLLALMLVPYGVYRWWVIQHDGIALSTSFYFSMANIKDCLGVGPVATAIGVFGVFRLHWLVLAVPFYMLGLQHVRVRWALLLIASVSMSLLIAYDTTRMLCWAFPVLVLGAVELGKCVGQKKAVAFLLAAWVLNFLIPPYTSTGATTHRLNGIRTLVEQ
jgi:hypothetical protein